MIMKLGWLFIIICVSYVLLVFKAPGVADGLDKIIGIDGFSQKVMNFKSTFDDVVTKVPTKEELKGAYNKAKDGIDSTKEKIDDFRGKAGEYKERYDDTVDYIEKTTEKIGGIKDDIDGFKNLISTGTLESGTQLLDSLSGAISK